MEYVNILTLGPIPPQERLYPTFRQTFISMLKMNAVFFKTSSECRHNLRQQGQKHRYYITKTRTWIIYKQTYNYKQSLNKFWAPGGG